MSYAQLEIDPVVNTDDGWENVIMENLFGCNTNVTNINYTGNINASGEFNYVQNDNLCSNYFGMNRGILMTSGHVNHAIGPNNDGDAGQEWNVQYDDPFLHDYLVDFELITPSINLFDACVLEFDVFSSGLTSVDFEVIFASDEYPEWMSPFYADVFCFFVSEINGDIDPNFNSIPKNIMETGSIINNLNVCEIENNAPISPWTIRPYSYIYQLPSVNECLYIDNQNGESCDAIGYDGYTVPMNFNLSLFPQASYHVKVVILDAVSGGWAGVDSGVFIKKTNISTSTDLDFDWSAPVYNDSSGVIVSFTPSYIDLDNIYYWDFNNDGLTDSNEMNPVFIFNQSGDYTVSLQVDNECSGISESVSYELNLNIINDVRLIEDTENIISVFPNPASQFISVSLKNCVKSAVIELIDMSGKLLYNKKIQHSDSYTIDISSIEQGLYYLQVNCLDTQDTYYEKIMIL
jgi:hypothetical protein